MKIPKQGFRHFINMPLHIATAGMLILISIFFVFLLFKLFFEMALLLYDNQISFNGILEQTFFIFLLIEVVAAIKIYFSENYHFPLRFFIYIGITDLVRQIIIQREHAQEVLLHAIALIILVFALAVLEMKNNWLLRNKPQDEEHFEL